MGGFPKYPVPRARYNINLWSYNPRWKGHTFFGLMGIILTTIPVIRLVQLNTVANMGYGNFIDPNQQFVPQTLKLDLKK